MSTRKPICLIVEWIDTVTHAGWQNEANKLPPMLCYTVGFLINQDDKVMRIASTLAIDGQYGDVSVIPLSLITHRKKLNVNANRPK